MGISNSQYEAIMRIYNSRQLQNRHEQDRRIKEIYEKIPAVKEINDEMARISVESARRAIMGDFGASAGLKARLKDMREDREALLKGYGYPADYMEMHYQCPACKDTGYAGDRKCGCFRQLEIDALYAQSNIKDMLERENFDKFSFDYFDDKVRDKRSGKTVREYMTEIHSLCKKYVDTFDVKKGSILFTGKTGLGKTYLSNCIAKALMDKSYSCVYLPAAKMFDIFAESKFSYDADEEVKNRTDFIMDCDLLIIDDLGTEVSNTFTTSQLFTVVNDRIIAGKGTIISTNMPVNEMRDEFTDRVMSRIVSEYTVIPLFGDDIRVKKKFGK